MVATAVLFAALLLAPGQGDKILTIKGTIRKVEVEADKVTILVRTSGDSDELIWFHILKKVPVTRTGDKKAKASELKVGQRLTIRTKNIQLDSDPPQMYAESVVIEADAKRD